MARNWAEVARTNIPTTQQPQTVCAPTDRENGKWNVDRPLNLSKDGRVPPPTCNMRALKYVQQWLSVWPDVLEGIRVLGDLEEAFYAHFLPWLFYNYSRNIDASMFIEQTVGKEPTPKQAYDALQAWVKSVEGKNQRPWIDYHCYTPAKNITWKNVVFVMSDKSNVFENGIIKIRGHYANRMSTFVWTETLETYASVVFSEKPLTEATRARRQAIETEEFWWGS